jgi:hypothetical protein
MAASRELAPVFHCLRLVGMLPFSRLDNDGTPCLRNSLLPRICTFAGHIVILYLYIGNIWADLNRLFDFINHHDEASDRVRIASTFATSFITQFEDLANLLNVFVLANSTCRIMQRVINCFNHCDEILHTSMRSKRRNFYITAFFVTIYVLKTLALFIFVHNMKFEFVFVPQIASAIFRGVELLLFVLCLELRSRLCTINECMITMVDKRNYCRRYVNISKAYESLCSAQHVLKCTLGSFLFLHLSQLFFMVLTILVIVIVSCVVHKPEQNLYSFITSQQHCLVMSLHAIDGMWRFLLITWSCSYPASEVSSFLLIFYITVQPRRNLSACDDNNGVKIRYI